MLIRLGGYLEDASCVTKVATRWGLEECPRDEVFASGFSWFSSQHHARGNFHNPPRTLLNGTWRIMFFLFLPPKNIFEGNPRCFMKLPQSCIFIYFFMFHQHLGTFPFKRHLFLLVKFWCSDVSFRGSQGWRGWGWLEILVGWCGRPQ